MFNLVKKIKNKRKESGMRRCEFYKETSPAVISKYSNDLLLTVEQDPQNKIYIDYLELPFVRIVDIKAKDFDSFTNLMSTVKSVAKNNDIKEIFFADKLDGRILKMFKKYGFVEHEADEFNHYLYFYL